MSPAHWHNTLRQHSGALTARAALPASAQGSSEYVACLLLEIENGPSIDFERNNVAAKHPVGKPWTTLAAVLTGAPALVLLIAYVSMALDRQTDLDRSYQAVRAQLLTASTFRDGDALAALAPPAGRLNIEGAWRLATSSLQNVPPGASLVVISQAARDRIVAERQEIARSYAAAWERFKAEEREYEAKWPYNPLEAFAALRRDGAQTPASTRPPKPRPPAIEPYRVAAGDIIAYMTHSQGVVPSKHEGVDPIVSELERPAPISAELYSNDRPYLLFPSDATKNWRESGFALIGGVICLLAFSALAGVLTRDHLRLRAFAASVRAAYAAKRGYHLA